MRLIAHLVTRNEAGRYLNQCLDWLSHFVDEINVFDDFSADDTALICKQAGAHVTTRSPEMSSFLDHEGMFRSAGWATLADIADPGDWVFAVDADEFLVPHDRTDLRLALHHLFAVVDNLGCNAVTLPIHEVWGFEDRTDRPMLRTDGYWGNLRSTRFARWNGDTVFTDTPLGCGSVPERTTPVHVTTEVRLLHYGYAAVDDRRARFERYNGRSGHNPRHINSILEHPTLVPWNGNRPDV